MLREILPEEAVKAVDDERALLERVREFVDGFEPDGVDAARVRELLDHLEDMFLLVVVGEVKAGKSSFINALLRSDVCPEGPLPLTDRVHVLAHGETDRETTVEEHISRRTVPVESLRRMNVVDTPGTNSPLRRHQEITESFLPRADIVFFVTSIDCPLTQTELQLLGDIRQRWKKEIACILAKIDIRTPKDRTIVLEYLRQSFRDHLGFEPAVFPVSSDLAREAHREGDDEKLEASGLAAVERYVVENLSESQRLLLKLRSPLGTVIDILNRLDSTASNQTQVLDRDFAGWNTIRDQVEFAATSLRERAERQLSPIHVAFENLEARGRRFLRESIRVTNLRLFADAGRFRAAFEKDVVRGAAAEIERKVDDAATWLAEETRALWERSLSHFNETVSLAKYREEIAAGAGPKFQETREETLQRIRADARKNLESWSVESECLRVRQLASKSLTRVLGTEVIAAGLGAAVVAALVPAGIGIVLAAGIALSGFFILPARRQKAVEGFEKGVRETRNAVLEAVREAIGEESDRAAAAVLDAFTPFHDFYEQKKRSLE
ncbi:MAG: dynamin family protein, partial [Planctomycetota bacterium]|nr:dynamin family protein [Planctomycetota bacterium]